MLGQFKSIFIIIFLCLAISGCDQENKVVGDRKYLNEQLITTETAPKPIKLPPQKNIKNWIAEGFGPSHSSDHYLLSDLPQKLWERKGNKSMIVNSPVIFEKNIFILNDNGEIISYDLLGLENWRVSVVPEYDRKEKNFGGGLALGYKNNLVATTGFGEIILLSSIDGKIRWRYQLGSSFNSAPIILDNKIFAISNAGQGVALSLDGEIIWSINGPKSDRILAIGASPAVGNGLVFMPFSGGVVSALETELGTEQWKVGFSDERLGYARSEFGEFSASPVIKDNRIYIGSFSGQIKSLDYSGAIIWSVPIGLQGTPVVVSNSVFFISDLGNLIRLDKETGRVVWSVKIAKNSAKAYHFGPILAGGKLWVVSSDKSLKGFSPESGLKISDLKINARPSAAPIYSSEKLFIVGEKGELLAFQ